MNNATKFANIIKTYDDGKFYECMKEATKATYAMARLMLPFASEEEVKIVMNSLLDDCVIGAISEAPDLCGKLFSSMGYEFKAELVDQLELAENMEV